jgi:hypothetical protein
MEGRLLLDVVVRKGTAILKLLTREDKALLIRRDSLLILDLGLHVIDRVRGLHIKSNGFARERLHKDLHPSAEAKDQMESTLLLDVVIRQGTTIFELLSGEDQTLLIRRDAFLVLNLGLDIVDRIGRLDVEGDGLTRQGLDEDLHTSAKTEHQVKRRLLLNVIVGERTSVLELLAGKDETLLVRGNTFLVLDLRLDVVNGIRRLDVERNGLSGQSFDKDLCYVERSRECTCENLP